MFHFQPPDVLRFGRRWSIGELVGSGGFGRVYVVQSDGVDPHVAKFIPQDPGADRELSFPGLPDIQNVIPVVEIGEWGDYWVIVMPKAEKSVADLLSEAAGPIPSLQASAILFDVAEALASIKDRVVHRDVKPANILFLDGRWCLADFGISRSAAATTATNTRKFTWTHQYAAPEQWRGETATSATDIYGFGAVAYHLLAGRPPFIGPDYRKQHLDHTPPPIPGIPPEMASLVDECLMKPPSARPSPDTVMSRLKQTQEPKSDVARRLQAANSRVVRQRLERASAEAAAQSERERKRTLRAAAEQSLTRIVSILHDQIETFASASAASKRPKAGWEGRLGRATLSVAPISQAHAVFAPRGDVTWEVLACSSVTLRTPRDQYGHEGMAHSLWYLRQSEDDAYRWYEVAFTIHALVPRRSTINPFSLPPSSDDAQYALSTAMHTIDVAKHPVPIDQGAEEHFVERWISCLADAAAAA